MKKEETPFPLKFELIELLIKLISSPLIRKHTYSGCYGNRLNEIGVLKSHEYRKTRELIEELLQMIPLAIPHPIHFHTERATENATLESCFGIW